MYKRTLTDLLLFNHIVAIVNSFLFFSFIDIFNSSIFFSFAYREKKEISFIYFYLLQRRFGSLVVISDSSIVNCLFPGDRCCCNIEPV